MLESYIYAIVSVLIVSFLSVVVALPLLIKKKVSNKVLIFLLSMSVGVLLATVFFDLVPEMYHYEGDYEEENLMIPGIFLLIGFLVMFLVEKFVHYHHTNKCESHDHGHSHGYNIAPVNLIGDGVHNFIDGLIIAGAYIVSIPVGISATISVIFHELPQELADLGVLLYSGMERKKAMMFNFLSALTAVVGTVLGLFLAGSISGFSVFMIPFAAGNFLYIASSNLLPQLHRHCKLNDTLMHFFAIILGIVLVLGVGIIFPHGH